MEEQDTTAIKLADQGSQHVVRGATCTALLLSFHDCKAWFRRRISHAPNRISQLGACEIQRLNQFEKTQMN